MWPRCGLTPQPWATLSPSHQGNGRPGMGLITSCPEWLAFRSKFRQAVSKLWPLCHPCGVCEEFSSTLSSPILSEERTCREGAGRKVPLLDPQHEPVLEFSHLQLPAEMSKLLAKNCISLLNSETSNITKNDSGATCGTKWRVSGAQRRPDSRLFLPS